MFLSVFDLFKVGIGPSSSHTVGPMIAARRFLLSLEEAGFFPQISKIQINVYGSLALTGLGHATDVALMLGLMGHAPDSIDPEMIQGLVKDCQASKKISLLGKLDISFDSTKDMPFLMEALLQHHTNGMEFKAFDQAGDVLSRDTYYSVGGGFVMSEAEMGKNTPSVQQDPVPYPFGSGRRPFSPVCPA